MKKIKPYLQLASLVTTVISLLVVVFGFFIRQTVAGYFATWVFALSFFVFVNLGIPSDDSKPEEDD